MYFIDEWDEKQSLPLGNGSRRLTDEGSTANGEFYKDKVSADTSDKTCWITHRIYLYYCVYSQPQFIAYSFCAWFSSSGSKMVNHYLVVVVCRHPPKQIGFSHLKGISSCTGMPILSLNIPVLSAVYVLCFLVAFSRR